MHAHAESKEKQKENISENTKLKIPINKQKFNKEKYFLDNFQLCGI